MGHRQAEQILPTMIAQLTGLLFETNEQSIVIDCQGVGYCVFMSTNGLLKMPCIGEKVSVSIHTHVREEAITLFGFIDSTEKSCFELLIQISGIGPKMALAILSGIEIPALIDAVNNNRLTALTQISGVGKKTAERLLLELKDPIQKLQKKHPHIKDSVNTHAPHAQIAHELNSALINLGYKAAQSTTLVEKLINENPNEPLESQLRKALQILNKKN